MTTSYQMLQTIRKVKKEGLTKEQSLSLLKKSGVVDKNGNVTKPYKDILYLK